MREVVTRVQDAGVVLKDGGALVFRHGLCIEAFRLLESRSMSPRGGRLKEQCDQETQHATGFTFEGPEVRGSGCKSKSLSIWRRTRPCRICGIH